ncbi:protein FAM184B-like [Lytechinus pictus]|uniref:protein FAM184B-like n=1 Tax=Lytechinus pictus TaxID=7653 RepID=UPI0030B9FADD
MADGGGGSGIPTSRLNNKKSFEHKMSKKVAELTQVVHMLFSRNHEREVELESTKEAYEQEISNVIADAKKRIEALEQDFAGAKRKTQTQAAAVQQDFERKLNEQKQESEKQFLEIWEKDGTYLKEIASLKEDIVKLQKELEISKEEAVKAKLMTKMDQSNKKCNDQSSSSRESSSGVDVVDLEVTSPRTNGSPDPADLIRLKEQLKVKEIENENLKHMVAMNVQTQRESDKAIAQFKKDLEKTEGELRLRISKLIDDATQANKAKEMAQKKSKLLETDIRHLKTRLQEKKKEASSNHEHKQRRSSEATSTRPGSRSSKSLSEVSLSDSQEEIERLRKEIKWYRMELSNREGNFNRMFADSNPIRLGGMTVAGPNLGMARPRPDQSVLSPSGSLSSRSDDGSHKSRSLPNRLPTLGMDGRQRDRTKPGHNSKGAGVMGASPSVREKASVHSISGYS